MTVPILLVIPLIFLLSAPVVLLLHRKLRKFRTAKSLNVESTNGIVEERFVRIGGMDQWISIRGQDRNNPVLLILHGGPGSSYSIFAPHIHAWEKYLTLVQWDQRGAGRTFKRTGPKLTLNLTMEQLTLDGIELSEFLIAHLQQPRIFLLASSIGSTFGLQVVYRRPDLFYAYIGTDQNVGMTRGCNEIHRGVSDRLRVLNMRKGAKAIGRVNSDASQWTADDFNTVTRWTMKSDPEGFGTTMKLLRDAVWFAPFWSLRDIRAFVAGMRFSLERLLPEITRFDAWQQGTHFEIPFFIFQGEHDVLTPPEMAREYFNDVDAPVKRMELISDAGHFAAFLQPERFLQLLRDHVCPKAKSISPRPALRA